MTGNYEDITSRIKEAPAWYDMHGAPRYGEFKPKICPDIYARWVALLRIQCQMCRRQFDVEMHGSIWDGLFPNPKKLHYGDPPVHRVNGEACMCAGSTPNCGDLLVLDAWGENANGRWVRHPELEGPME